MTETYSVHGMTCGGCARGVTNAVEKLGVKVVVDLERKTVTVDGEHDPVVVREAIEGAGFEFAGPAKPGV